MYLKYIQIVNYKNLRKTRFEFGKGANTLAFLATFLILTGPAIVYGASETISLEELIGGERVERAGEQPD